MDDIRFTFGGDPTDAARASERVESKLEQLQHQALQTSAALKTIGAPRSGAIAQMGASSDRERRRIDLLGGSLGRITGTMTKVNVQFRFFQNLMGLIRWPAIITGVGLLTQGLSALAAGAVAVTAAIAPMGGAIAALPAVLGAAVQGIATFKLALGGLDDALKAQKEGTNAVEEAQLSLRGAMKNHREVAKDASRGSLAYRESLLEVQKAQKAVKEAQEASNPALERFAALIDNKIEPSIARLRRSASRGLLPGLGRGIMAAMGGLGGQLERIVGRTGGVLGAGAQQLGGLLGGRGGDVGRIGNQNIRVISNLSSALTSLTSALLDVMVAGGPFVNWLARGANQFAQWIERATFAGRRSGELAEFFDSAKDSLVLMWNVLRPFGAALINIFQAAAPLGREIMEDLAGAAEGFQKWTESVEGENKLAAYFEAVKPSLYAVAELVSEVAQTFFRIGSDPGFAAFVDKLRVDLLPTIERLVRQTTAQFGPALTDALVALADLIAALAGSSGPLTIFVQAIAGIAKFFTMIVESTPIIRGALFTLIGFATTMAALKFTGMITGLATVLGLMRGISARTTAGAAATGFLPTLSAVAGPRAATAVPGGAVGGAPGRAPGTFGAPVLPIGAGVATAPVAPRAGFRGQIRAAGPPAAAIGGFLASGVGASMGGVAGNVLMGAGIGAAIGAPFGGVGAVPGAVIGAGAGAIGGGLLAALGGIGKSAPEIDKVTASLNMLGQTFRNVAGSTNAMAEASEAVRDTNLNVAASNIQVERAERTLSQIRKQFGKNSLEAREAEINLKIARENQRDALKANEKAEKDSAEAAEANRKARTDQAQQMERTADLMRDEIQAIKDRKIEGRANAEQVAAFEEQKQKDLNAAVDRYQEKMRKSALTMRQQNRPELAKLAEAADRVANRINAIPTQAQINAEIRFSARFDSITSVETNRQFGGGSNPPRGRTPSTSEGDGPGDPTQRWFNDQANTAIMAGARSYIERNKDAIKSKLMPAGGDIIAVGRWLQSQGYLVGEHPAFGGVTPGVHVKNSYHYRGRALDVNWPGGGAAEMSAMDAVEPTLAAMHPAELLWRTKGHYDHLHVAFRQGGLVGGKGKGDSVPAMLSPGEAVLTGHGQSLVDAVGGPGTMARILGAQMPHFAHGGKVKSAAEYVSKLSPGERAVWRRVGVRLFEDGSWRGRFDADARRVADRFGVRLFEDHSFRPRGQPAPGAGGGGRRRSPEAAALFSERQAGLLERLEMRHEMSGTGTTASEMMAQARFIRRRIIPAERAELRALQRARRRALANDNKELARELKQQIFQQQTEILRLQLEAQQRTRQAAEETAAAMKEFGGGIGFQFGSSLFTDRLLGSMVGA